MKVAKFLIVLFLLFITCLCVSSFKSYNNEERERFLKKFPSREENEVEGSYDPTWDSLDARPLPSWFDEAKIGVFVHWGVSSVPGVESEWFWKTWRDGRPECVKYMKENFKPGFTYQEFGPLFTFEFYNGTEYALLIEKSGAKYTIVQSKHHDGYALWPSKYSFSWNSKDVGPHLDLLGDFATNIREWTDVKFGLYHSLFEWYHPLYLQDKENNFTTDDFVMNKVWPEMKELVETYKPEIFWSDGEWETSAEYWRSQKFLSWLYNTSPVRNTVLTNDRWGQNTLCKHGGFYTCADRYNPGVLQPHKWENAFTLDKQSWGIRRNAEIKDYLTPEELIATIVETVACGGNALVGISTTPFGTIPVVQQERLIQMGTWLETNGNAIYKTKPWKFQNDTITPGVWFTQSSKTWTVCAIMTKWPTLDPETIHLGAVQAEKGMVISLAGYRGEIRWKSAPKTEDGILITLPSQEEIASKWAWTFIITGMRK